MNVFFNSLMKALTLSNFLPQNISAFKSAEKVFHSTIIHTVALAEHTLRYVMLILNFAL